MDTNNTSRLVYNTHPQKIMDRPRPRPHAILEDEETISVERSGATLMLTICRRSDRKFYMTCTAKHRRDIRQARFYCQVAAKALIKHRADYECDCDFVHLGRRKRLYYGQEYSRPIKHLLYVPGKVCRLEPETGAVIRAAMYLHDQHCSCGGFGEPQAEEEPHHPTRAFALQASDFLHRFQSCDAKFYMQEAVMDFWSQTDESVESWYSKKSTTYNKHNTRCSRGCLSGLSSGLEFNSGVVDTTPKPAYLDEKCDVPEKVCHANIALQAHRYREECFCTFEQFLAGKICQQPCTRDGVTGIPELILKHDAKCLRGCFHGKNTAAEHIEHVEIEDESGEDLEYVDVDSDMAEDWDDCSVDD